MTDLLETGDAITTEIDFNAPPPVRERKRYLNAQGYEQGICRVCGKDAPTPTGTYCAEHKTRQTKSAPPIGDGQSAPSGTQRVSSPPKRTGRGAPTGDEWSSKVFDKIILVLTALYASSMVSRMGINDPQDTIADELTMTDDEARRVAKPLGRFVAGTDLNKRYGRKVLENSDLIDAGFALYDWQQRCQGMLKQFQSQGPLAVVSPIHPSTQPQGESEYGPSESPVEQPGIPDPGGFPNLSGAVFIP